MFSKPLDAFPISASSSEIALMPDVSNQQPEQDFKSPNSELMLPILPREIWLNIGKRLESRLDLVRFRSVCRRWRSSLPPPFRFPIRVPRPPGPSPIRENDLYFITEVTFYSANDMIVVFEEEYRGGEFSASAFVHLKRMPTKEFELPPVTQISNLSFLSKGYHVHNAAPRYYDRQIVANKYNFSGNLDVLKIEIICSDGSPAINPNYPRFRDLKVVAHLYDRKLAVLSLCGGAMSNDWVTGFCPILFDDIVNYRGQLYCVDKLGRAFVMDYNSLLFTQVAAALPGSAGLVLATLQALPRNRKVLHLTVVSEDLYMFLHDPRVDLDALLHAQHGFVPRLYKLSSRLGQWLVAEEDLSGQVFIQNLHCNFPVAESLVRRCCYKSNDNGVVPRFCSWPEFDFVRVAVGFRNEYQSPDPYRYCDIAELPYFTRRATTPQTHPN